MKRQKRSKLKRNPKIDDLLLTDREISNLIFELKIGIILGYPEILSDIIQLINIGDFCTDCRKNFRNCECEKCPDCKFNRCLCNIKNNDFNQIRIEIFNLAKELFNKKDFDEFKKETLIESNHYDSLKAKDYNFVKELLTK